MEVPGRRAASVDVVDQTSETDQFDTLCQPCAVDGQHKNAKGYCTTCGEYLCRDCYKVHRNLRATRKHVFVDMTDMSHCDAPSSQASDMFGDKMTDTCTKHADETLRFYCKTHNNVACTVCVTLYHRLCHDVQYIPDISAGTSDSQACKDLLQELKALTDKFTNMEFQAGESLEAVEKASDAYSQQVQTYRDQLVAIIDKLAAQAEDNKKTYVENRITQLNSTRKVSQDSRHNIEAVTSQINDRRLAVQEKMLFVSMKQAENLATVCLSYITSADNNLYVSPFKFKYNEKLHRMLSKFRSLGDMTSIQLTDEIDVQAASEGESNIGDLHILSDGRLIVADRNNRSVKLFDSNHRLKSLVQLQSHPWHIAEVSSGEVAVSLPYSQTIQFLSISGDLNPGRTINTNCRPWGMAISGDIIILLTPKTNTSTRGCCIVKLDLNGRKLQTADNGSVIDIDLKVYKEYIRIHPTNNNIYVSDVGAVTCMTQQGKLVAEYKDAELRCSRLIVIHPDGSVFACGGYKIHHITAECKKIDVILGHGEIVCPRSICFDRDGKLLYVGEENTKLNVFRLFL